MKTIIIVTKNKQAQDAIKSCFDTGYHIEYGSSCESCLQALTKRRFDFIFIDIELLRHPEAENDHKKQLQPFWQISPDVEMVILTSPQMTRETVNIVKAGASNYLTYPIDPAEVKYVVDSIHKEIQLNAELKYLRNQFWHRGTLGELQTKSPIMREVLDKVRAVAPSESTVLLTGETGTGKGIIANIIHQHSKRSEKQLISIHCGAIPDTLLESELFGHEKGAFTGAVRRKLGKFEIVADDRIGKELLGCVNRKVKVTGLLAGEYFDSSEIIFVTIYQLIGGQHVKNS